MRKEKKLLMGVLLFAITLAATVSLSSSKVSALTATSQDQLTALAGTLKKSGNDITGTLNGKTITFKNAGPQTANGLPTGIAKYEAQNLDCNGEKAYITANFQVGQIANGNSPGALNAKFKNGGNCSEQKTIQISINSSGQASVAANGSGTPDDGKGCDVSLDSPLSWIMCPLIEGGSNFVDFVFTSIVKPLLSEVPISTDPDDGGYKAWKQFRLLGNIVLVGSMLAVVYAQVRGDR